MSKPTVIEEVLELHKRYPDAKYVSQPEFNDIFNGMTQDQRRTSNSLEMEAKQREEWWYVNGWAGLFADGKLALSDVMRDPTWPEMFAQGKKYLESEGKQDVITEFERLLNAEEIK